ncbi:MAG: molybdopterin biosynthesis protein [Chloroflexi bacterium]|nr:molybdopterin biosynthesis protein [Chloroflexota bacterium]
MTPPSVYLEDLPLDEARARLETALRAAGLWTPLPGEPVPLSQALGRITAEPVWAKRSAPHYHAAAMDGYAVNAADTTRASESAPARLRLGENAFAVDTGDPLPPGTNAVIMIEDTHQPDDHHIEIRAALAPRQHVRLLGEDMVETELVLPANHRLRPVDLGALAGCGHPIVQVRRPPFVVLIPTGDELLPPEITPQPGQITEYNSLVLAAQISESGGRAQVMPITPDNPQRLRAALQQAISQNPDLILILSGSSAGSHDYTAALVRETGQLLVHGVAVRPGHPVILGMAGAIPLIGVPGYPVSAALTGEIFVQPLLALWSGQRPLHDTLPRLTATLTRKILSPIGDDDYVRVTLARVGEKLLATPLSRGAGVITSLVRADGLAHVPRFSEGIDSGGAAQVMLYRSPAEIERTLLIMGSHDPLLDLLAQFMAARGWRLTSGHVGSLGGLAALRRGQAHLAGIHLLDTNTGAYNRSYVAQYLPGEPVQLVNFAYREQGLLVAPGNPLRIAGFADLPRVRYVNRQRGAGTRLLLDYELARHALSPAQIQGYEHEEYTHLAVAAAVASRLADCGLGVRSAAVALKLDFVSVGWERYDLAIPAAFWAHPGVTALLHTLRAGEFRAALAAQAGYDSKDTGQIME